MDIETVLVPEMRKLSTEERNCEQRSSMFGLSTPIAKCRRRTSLDDFDGIRSILSHSTIEEDWTPYVQPDGSLFYVLVSENEGSRSDNKRTRCFYISNITSHDENNEYQEQQEQLSSNSTERESVKDALVCEKCNKIKNSSHSTKSYIEHQAVDTKPYRTNSTDNSTEADLNNNLLEDVHLLKKQSSQKSTCCCASAVSVSQSGVLTSNLTVSKYRQMQAKASKPSQRLSKLQRLRSKFKLEG